MGNTKSEELVFSLTKKDFNIEFFKASGKGGQNRNKRLTACRITHPASGAVGYSSDEREQHQNKKAAFIRLTSSDIFKAWLKRHFSEVLGTRKSESQIRKEVDEMIENDLKNGNIIIEPA